MNSQQLKASVAKAFMLFWFNFAALIVIGLIMGSPVLADKRKEMLADLLSLNVSIWVPSPLAFKGMFKSKEPCDDSDSE